MSLVTIRAFDTPEEAHLLKGHLKAAGIESIIQNEFTVGTDWALSNAVGGVQVQVEEADLPAARAVLGTARDGHNRCDVCPACGSKKIDNSLWRKLDLLTLVLFSLPVPWYRHDFQCSECGHKWKWKP